METGTLSDENRPVKGVVMTDCDGTHIDDGCKIRGCKDGEYGCVVQSPLIRLVDRKPPSEPLADFYGKIRDTARLTDGITLAERIAVLDVVRAELVASFQSQVDAND